jgi:hypothetical protein
MPCEVFFWHSQSVRTLSRKIGNPSRILARFQLRLLPHLVSNGQRTARNFLAPKNPKTCAHASSQGLSAGARIGPRNDQMATGGEIQKCKWDATGIGWCPRPRPCGAENDNVGPKTESHVCVYLRAITWGLGITGKRRVGGAARERKIT